MKKYIFVCLAAMSFFAHSDPSGEPARRPQPQYNFSFARAVCKDETYNCMYSCEVREGAICTPTRGSDARCPNRKVTNGHWFSNRLVVLDFEGYHDMGCNVTARARTDMVCGNGRYGYECHKGRMHER